MDNLKIDERLNRIEKLLLGSKKVLSFDEACDYTGFSRSYMYKMTGSNNIPHSKPNGKIIFFEKEKLDQWLLRNGRKSNQEIEKEASLYTSKTKRG
jgi:excisionase family DNA binding protein